MTARRSSACSHHFGIYEQMGRTPTEPECVYCGKLEREWMALSTAGQARYFDTGATRDTDEGKLDYEGFLSPLVLKRFAEYMHKCRKQTDGKLRDSDNWRKGIPRAVYMKSMWRHFFSVWNAHRSGKDCQEELCALLFNVMGMLDVQLQGFDVYPD
jgi:hypothetical protein